MKKEAKRKTPYYLVESQLQKLSFLFVFPIVNWLFMSSTIFEMGEINENVIISAGIKIWLIFAISYLIIHLTEKHLSAILKLKQFWRKLAL